MDDISVELNVELDVVELTPVTLDDGCTEVLGFRINILNEIEVHVRVNDKGYFSKLGRSATTTTDMWIRFNVLESNDFYEVIDSFRYEFENHKDKLMTTSVEFLEEGVSMDSLYSDRKRAIHDMVELRKINKNIKTSYKKVKKETLEEEEMLALVS